MVDSPPLSVLIPTHGRSTLLGRTLASLAECCIPAGYVETVVVENGPKSGAEHVVADSAVQWPHLKLRYLHVPRANKSHALNEAMRGVEDGLLVFFDDDVRIAPETLEAYAAAAGMQPENTFFGGPTGVDYEAVPPVHLWGFLPPSARGLSIEAARASEFLGFNWAAYLSDLRRCSGFDENFGPGSTSGATGQESDMQNRLRARGVERQTVKTAFVWHYVPMERCSPEWIIQRQYRMGKMTGRRAREGNGAKMTRACVRAIVRSPGRAALARIRRDAHAQFSERAGMSFWRGYLAGYFLHGRERKS